jgi:hypothetical protein
MRHSYIFVALLLTACAHLRIEGPYAANLSEADIAQLKALPLPDYYRPILVTTIARDHVKIWAGRTTEKIPTYRELHAYRRNGTWHLVIPAELPAPNHNDRVIVL